MSRLLGRLISRLNSLRDRRLGKRVLVHEILSIQILSAAIVGGLAIAVLYWGSQWVLKDNYSRWALQWTEELNELGSPLYLSDDSEALVRLESFVERYPEIAQVSYYGRDGKALFIVANGAEDVAPDDLPESRLTEAKAVVGGKDPYVLSGSLIDPRQFEVLAPVWTEAIASDGMAYKTLSIHQLSRH